MNPKLRKLSSGIALGVLVGFGVLLLSRAVVRGNGLFSRRKNTREAVVYNSKGEEIFRVNGVLNPKVGLGSSMQFELAGQKFTFPNVIMECESYNKSRKDGK